MAQQMHFITRTLWGSSLQTSLLLDLPHDILQYTTLNEALVVRSGVYPTATDRQSVHYFGIGNGGHQMVVGGDGVSYTLPVQHRAIDAGFYNQMPFVLRTPDNDLTPEQRSNYALRKAVNINDTQYVGYYLKRLDMSEVVNKLIRTFVTGGVETPQSYTPESACLTPTPPALSNSSVNTTDGEYVSTEALVKILFDEFDVNEYINVAEIMYNNPYRAVISEIGICAGVDSAFTSTIGGISVGYVEAIAVQVVTFITSYWPVGFSNTGFSFDFTLGASEPMLTLESQAVVTGALNP